MFKVGEFVLHRNEGICHIDSIESCDFGYGAHDYYIMHSHYVLNKASSIIRIPVNHCTQIRYPLDKKEALKIIDNLPNEENIWIVDKKERKENFERLIEEGGVENLCSLIHTIYQKKIEYQKEKKIMPLTDNSLSRFAERLAYEELGFALEINPVDVEQFIIKRLKLD